MKSSCARRALVLLLLQAHVAAFSGPSPGQRRPRVQASPTSASRAAPRTPLVSSRKPASRTGRRPRLTRSPHIVTGGGGSGPHRTLPLTALQGWFDGLGGEGRGSKEDKGESSGSGGGSGGGGAGGGKAPKRGGPSSSSGKDKRRGGDGGRGSSPGFFSIFGGGGGSLSDSDSGTGSGRDSSSGQKGMRPPRLPSAGGRAGKVGRGGNVKGKYPPEEETGAERGALQVLRDSFAAGANAFQERFLQESQNVTFVFGGGAMSNVSIPWKGLGVYGGGVLSGLAIAVGLLTVPYADLGSPGLRKSLTLFENVLVDIDQGYVEEVNPERLLETAVVSMLRTLDPYTEYQNNQAAADLKESVSGRYGGVGLVISGGKQQKKQTDKAGPEPPAPAGQTDTDALPTPKETTQPKGDPKQQKNENGPSNKGVPLGEGKNGGGGKGGEQAAARESITVVSAFEGYAFDAGVRPGDRITAINGQPVSGASVDKARDLLRGEPESTVSISFIRDGGNPKEQEVTLTRRLVKLRDVKLATLVGDVQNAPVGYLELSGFSQGAAKELRQAYRYLDQAAKGGLRGVILDMRGNPGGLLESAVDVAAMFVPEGSSIVSIKGRNFNDITYGSSQAPVRPALTPLVVLINGGTASAAEIVSGAVQDLDAGVIVGVGDGRTYGKGLVQNVAELPYNNALKYTVAKYYTPSGRCIQSVNYKEGGVAMGDQPAIPGVGGNGFGFEANEVPELERKEFVTQHGRVVFDGGGVEADVKVKLPKPSALEIALQIQGAYFDFAGQWTQTHTFKGTATGDVVTDAVLRDFKNFVLRRQKEGTYDLAGIYGPQLRSLESILEDSNLSHIDRLVEPLPKRLTQEMLMAFDSHQEQIRSALEESILSRFLPESMVLRKQLEKDPQFQVALELVQNKDMYSRIITPADAKLTEDVLRNFGQALKDSVQRGELRLDMSPDENGGGGVTVTPTSSQGVAAPAHPVGGDETRGDTDLGPPVIPTGPNRRSLPQR